MAFPECLPTLLGMWDSMLAPIAECNHELSMIPTIQLAWVTGGATTVGPDATHPPAICQNSGHGPRTAIFQNSGGGGGVAYKDWAQPPPPPPVAWVLALTLRSGSGLRNSGGRGTFDMVRMQHIGHGPDHHALVHACQTTGLALEFNHNAGQFPISDGVHVAVSAGARHGGVAECRHQQCHGRCIVR